MTYVSIPQNNVRSSIVIKTQLSLLTRPSSPAEAITFNDSPRYKSCNILYAI
jgi:hypothetical protein